MQDKAINKNDNHQDNEGHEQPEPLPPELERYLALCKRVVERMKRDGKWPWKDKPDRPDSQESSDMVESDDNPNLP